MRVLLTGAAGFIGARVHTALAAAGHDVVAVDAMLPAAHGQDAAPPAKVHRIDVRDAGAVADVLDGVDVVCHQAAVVGAGVDAADAPRYASHNDFGTAVLLAQMFAAGCRRLVLASSMVVYGQGRFVCAEHGEVDPLPRRRADLDAGVFDHRCPVGGEPVDWALVGEDAPLRPRSLYAASKAAQEHYALAWSEASGGAVTALRYHNVYGPGMPRDTPYSGVAAIFRSALERGDPPKVFEDGGQMRDFVHVDDVAAANVAAVESGLTGFAAFNVCSGRPVTILEVATALCRARGDLTPQITGAYRDGDVRHIVADPAKAAQELNFRAAVDPADGLAEFADAPLRG
ncbi:NAD-dependent dehydratase [Mycolicibacterium duvalii]|uniref:UDP-glucose 4-epimerase n=1 Tax=Mycolicibacterium duvalii TaxID=39688 RepID=A0A7I7K5I0_9MYCO|nr:NAD-dependent epimerase/dehydratase family protein [Mycolicibacterium duvalii]MCV7367582.1 NAD-dependent epimerase/dehydratase family protein [Mycolicibacterium duvalii]PEG44105.1 NAD-dependent dehydratase [Mycolicibacterium duvalii]BBX18828.1 UDP-glucose 4-epimerase [Mycolicibacterium duvalii]